jgi:four helix bundle protein
VADLFVVLLAQDLGLLEHDEHDQLHEDASEIKRMLTSFVRKLNADS